MSQPVPVPTASHLAARENAREYAGEALAPNTLRAYRADWADFTTWCQRGGVSALPAEPATVAAYLASLATTHSRAALRRRLTAIGQAHRLKELDWSAGPSRHPQDPAGHSAPSRDTEPPGDCAGHGGDQAAACDLRHRRPG